jgi:hypothetical protein
MRFKKEHPNVNVSLRAFESLKPYVELLELLHGWNNMRGGVKGVYGRRCDCSCDVCDGRALGKCMAEFTYFGGLTDFWTLILYPTLESGWYKLECLMGHYRECGQDMLITCSTEVQPSSEKLVQ